MSKGNNCFFRGHLGAAPVTKTFGKRTKTTFSMAHNPGVKANGDKMDAVWINSEHWNGAGLAVQKLDLQKGECVEITGCEFSTRTYKDAEGKKQFWTCFRGGVVSRYEPMTAEEEAMTTEV
jgi:hypothetical protein